MPTDMTLRGGDVTRLLELDGGRLGVARTAGALDGETGDTVAWMLIEGGSGELIVEGDAFDITGRDDVFATAGWSVLLGRGRCFSLGGHLRSTVVWRGTDRDVGTRVIPPEEVVAEERGEDANFRLVRTYIGAGPIIAGETINRPGRWSSYPPHRHEHEEVYLYRFEPSTGFGAAIAYEDDRSSARMVRDGDVQRITSGYHPVVAAPGYQMYYLWALAGVSDTLAPEFDPVHAV